MTDSDPSPATSSARRPLLPEERSAGSDDAEREAGIILEDSERRTEDPEQARHESSQSPERNANPDAV